MNIKTDNINVTIYSNKNSRYGKNVELKKAIFTHEFKDKINELRKEEYHSEKYDEIKFGLPIMTVHGTCEYGKPKSKENIKLNKTICIDVDLSDNPRLFEVGSIDDWKMELINQDDVILVCKSCGGRGMMIIHRLDDKVNNDNFIKYYLKLEKRYKEKWNIVIDSSCKNINRLRYVTFDDEILFNEIYEQLELTADDLIEHKPSNNTNIAISVEPEYIVFSGEGWYFGHGTKHIQNGVIVPTIEQMIHTMLAIFKNKEIVKNIWLANGFYSKDAKKERILEFIDNWKEYDESGNELSLDKYIPSVYIIKWMNKYLGYHFDIQKTRKTDDLYIDDFYSNFISYSDQIEFKDEYDSYTNDLTKKDFLSNYYDRIVPKFTNLNINMIVCNPGRGKTTFVKEIRKKENAKILLIEPYKSVIKNKFNDIDCDICIEDKHIEKNMEFVITHYNHFNTAFDTNELNDYDYIFIDESHIIGTQSFREDVLIEFSNKIIRYNDEHQKCKIVLMTGTPTNEQTIFGEQVNHIFTFKENQYRDIELEYVVPMFSSKINKKNITYSKNPIQSVVKYAEIAKENGHKFFIYWGKGSIVKDQIIQETIDELHKMKVAIYHKRNDNTYDTDTINNNQCIGDFDGIISSCYFSVGCDLNDEEDIDVIIVGNNPWYEDIQTIGRLRKSNNIKVYVIVDDWTYYKVNASKVMKKEYDRMSKINEAKKTRQTSLINKLYTDDEIFTKVEIHTYDEINSDIKLKFDKYDEYGIVVVNGLNIDNGTYYILPKNGNQEFYDIIEKIDIIKENYNHGIKDVQSRIIHNLRCDINYDIESLLDEYIRIPKLEDWLKGILMIQHHYNIDKLLELDDETIYKVSKKQLNPIVYWNIKYKSNDKVENDIIEQCIKIKDDNKWNNENCAKAYILWMLNFDKDNDYEFSPYDTIDSRMNYPIYKEWKSKLNAILNIDKDIRKIILYKENFEIDEYTKIFFDLDDDIKKKINTIKNPLVNNGDLLRFYEIITNSKKEAGKNSSPKKKCIITDKFKFLNKYNLKIGQEFDSYSDLAQYVNKNRNTITKWKSKDWIK